MPAWQSRIVRAAAANLPAPTAKGACHGGWLSAILRAPTFTPRDMSAFYALIPAAGVGSRMAADVPKQYLEIAGKQVLRHVLDAFASTPAIAGTFIAVNADDAAIDAMLGAVAHKFLSTLHVLRCGGVTRRDTVRNALSAMRQVLQDDDWVLVHDAARPGVTSALLERLIAGLHQDTVGGLLAVPVVDTLKRANAGGRSIGTVPRDDLWQAQTPQMFRYGLLCRALAQEAEFTDEAAAVEALGLAPKLVPGDVRNFKLTLPADVIAAALYLTAGQP